MDNANNSGISATAAEARKNRLHDATIESLKRSGNISDATSQFPIDIPSSTYDGAGIGGGSVHGFNSAGKPSPGVSASSRSSTGIGSTISDTDQSELSKSNYGHQDFS